MSTLKHGNNLLRGDAAPESARMDLLPDLGLALTRWYATNARALPWRDLQDDPYAVMVSEFILQQTQAATAAPRFEAWMKRFPDVASLADASLDDVLFEWQGLGYYGRARRLHGAARTIVAEMDGRVPKDSAALASLPGVGEYTVAAIQAIAFRTPAPAVDANARRVLGRVLGLAADCPEGARRTALGAAWLAMAPRGEAREFAQALMDLGSDVCTPATPQCARCPLTAGCAASASGNPEAYAVISRRPKITKIRHVSVVLWCGGFAMVRRIPRGTLWSDLWEFPRCAVGNCEDPRSIAIEVCREATGRVGIIPSQLATVRHSVTRYSVTLHGYLAVIGSAIPRGCGARTGRWLPWSAIERLPLPSPQSRLRDAARVMIAEMVKDVAR